MRIPRATRLVAILGAAATAAGCSSSETVEPAESAIEVTVRTEGTLPDPDGYTLTVDGVASGSIGVNGTVTLEGLEPGTRTIRLGGLATNCYLSSDAERKVNLRARTKSTLEYVVVCPGEASGVQISTLTSGPDIDADGYDVTVGGRQRKVPANGTTLITGVPVGDQPLTVTGIAPNCAASPANPTTARGVTNQVVTVGLTFTCVGVTGTARVVTTTTGSSPDRDGYGVVTTRGTTPIGSNATVLITRLPAGANSVELSGVAANCSVEGGTNRSAAITVGGTTDVTFAVTCQPLASMTVTTSTGGSIPDPDGYTVRVILDDYYGSSYMETKPVATGGSVAFPDLQPGTYSVLLEGLAPNCIVVSGTASRSVEVRAVAITEVFVVQCDALGQLAVTVGNGAGAEIYLTDVAGSVRTRLTSNATLDDDAAWSPDGNRIAFASERDGNREIYVMNADGSGQVRLTTATGTDSRPAWSPNGSRIAFKSNRDGNDEIYVMNADGTNPTRLTTDPASDADPTWSPDGQKIAFTRAPTGGASSLYVMNASGTGTTFLYSGAVGPAWAPDGYSILFVTFADDSYYGTTSYLMQIVPNGSNPLVVGAYYSSTLGDPAWSPDGGRIASTIFATQGCGSCQDQVVLFSNTGLSLGQISGSARNPAWRP